MPAVVGRKTLLASSQNPQHLFCSSKTGLSIVRIFRDGKITQKGADIYEERKYSAQQVTFPLRQVESGTPVPEV